MNETSFPASASVVESDICAGIVDAIGTETFFNKTGKLLEGYMSYEGLNIVLYSENNAPTCLEIFKKTLDLQEGLENFLSYTYIINPVYRAFLGKIASGTYLIGDLLPAGYRELIANSDLDIWIDDKETIGYRTPGWPKNLTEVLVLIWLPDNKMIEFSFLTTLSGDQTEKCHNQLRQIYPVLSSAILKHFEFAAQDFDVSEGKPSQEYRFQEFGKDILTPREQDITKMILTGHSSNSIGLNLDISLPTVKTHRRNIYAKLQISSQAELFNLFVRSLMVNK
ncbi:response regulator transcription factor [Kiloniella antarctica]|uniref:Response regulator transcription factor n=1 Tax=Kiloniella antarctica TaxID=1550907 RepID=A0ABW5BJT8_9PROT